MQTIDKPGQLEQSKVQQQQNMSSWDEISNGIAEKATHEGRGATSL